MLKRSAGILIPLFSIRTRDSLGRGEILDLAPMIDFALSMGHRVIQLLPLDETDPEGLSPYSAMSVMAIDPMYISVRGLTGVGRVVLARAREPVGKGRFVPRSIIRREKFTSCSNARIGRCVRAAVRDESAQLDVFIEANVTGSTTTRCFARSRIASTGPSGKPGRTENCAARSRSTRCGAARAGRPDRDVQLLAVHRASAMVGDARVRSQSHGALIGGDLAFSPCRDSAEVWANQDEFDLTAHRWRAARRLQSEGTAMGPAAA